MPMHKPMQAPGSAASASCASPRPTALRMAQPHNDPMPHRRRTVYATLFATLLAVAVLAAAAGLATVYLGLYNVAASEQHFKPVYQLLESAMHQSVKLRARSVVEPPPFTETMVLRGAGCYRD